MKRSRAVLLSLVAFLSPIATAVAQAPATIILVRHAEKGGEPTDRDPELSEAGRQRAAELARVLGDANMTYVSLFDASLDIVEQHGTRWVRSDWTTEMFFE